MRNSAFGSATLSTASSRSPNAVPWAQPGRLRALLQFRFEIGVVLGAHHDDLKVVVIFDLGDDVVVFQHVLVQEIAEREVFRIVADRHHGDDLLGVQIQRQRPLHRHPDFDGRTGLVGAGDALGQPRILGIRHDQGGGGFLDFHHIRQVSMTMAVSRYKAPLENA